MRHSEKCKVAARISSASILILLPLLLIQNVSAEGTADLGGDGEGYRPYTERNRAKTFGQERLSHMQVYLKSGETVYFGTSVCNGTLYNEDTATGYLFTNDEMGTSFSAEELKYLNTADVWIYKGTGDELGASSLPYAGGKLNADAFLIDIPSDATSSTPGFIYNGAQEAGGVDLTGKGTGYKVSAQNTLTPAGTIAKGAKTNANSFTATSDGIYSVVFFSSGLTADNPKMMKMSDKTTPFADMQKGSTIASWDISVYNNGTLQTGRVFTKTLFLNVGGNALSNKVSTGALYSKVYAVTDDGYQYKVDFNGMDPYGFVFFANSRGLLKTDTSASTSSSLYHGARGNNNLLSDFTRHNIAVNVTPYDTALDKTYHLFYEKPSAEALSALNINDPSSGNGQISDFKFTGTGDSTANEGYVGKGGAFSFTASSNISATSYQIQLDFSQISGGTVILSNSLVKGTNTISWDGRDANGKVVPAGTYQTLNASLVLKGGEVHFPLLDVEQNPFGVKITRLNGTGSPDTKVFFNNSASNAGDAASPWTIEKNWMVGSQDDASAGVDSADGAMAFTNVNTKNGAKGMNLLGDGDQSALDLWAYYNRSVTLGNWSFKLMPDASFTVTKVWDRTGQAAANPTAVTMTLQQSSDQGANWKTVTTDMTGAQVTNPATYDTADQATYTWDSLDPTLQYQVVETHITGYSTVYGEIGKTVNADTGKTAFTQSVTNTYKPTTLQLTKVWNMNGSTEAHPSAVTLSVFTDDKKQSKIGDYALNDDNNWTVTVNPVDPTLTYYVYETAASTNGAAMNFDEFEQAYTITGQGKVSGNGDSSFSSTITNTFNSGDYMSVEVFKYWVDGDTWKEYQPSEIQVTLKNGGEKVTTDATGQEITNPVTLNDANSWYYIWPALVAKDTSAAGYTIEETDANGNVLSGYTAKYDEPNFLHNFGYAGVENTYQTTSFTAVKQWVNGIGEIPSSVTMQLMQSTDGGTTYIDYGIPQTLNAPDWQYVWSDLPSYTADNVKIQYKVEESPVQDYRTDYGNISIANDGTFSETITNTYQYTDLKVSKTWNYGSQTEKDRPNAVGIIVNADDTERNSYFCILSEDNNWSETFSDLPVYSDGKVITYSASELSLPKYTQTGGTISGSAQTGYTVSFLNTYQNPSPSNPPAAPSTPANPWTPSYQIRFLDCSGKVISEQWVAQGQPAVIPAGYHYSQEELNWVYRNLTVSPDGCSIKYNVPNTADH